jgi:hypothetical protein
MASTTGLGRNAYNEQVKSAQNDKAIADVKALLSSYKEQQVATVAMVRDLRELHVRHLGTPNSDYLANAISEMDYRVSSLRRNVKDYQIQLDRLEGNTPSVDEDD